MMDSLKRLTLSQFGKFNDKEFEIKPNFNAYFGMNEAGKSTLVEGVKSLYYGYSPANIESHPYAPWNGNGLQLSGLIGSREIVRTMRTSINGKVIEGNDINQINNRPLPDVSHISKNLFESVFSISAEDLANIEGKSWEEIEDKVLLNYDSNILKSPSGMIRDIDSDLSIIWRDSNRGKTQLKSIDESLRVLKKRLRDLKLEGERFNEKLLLESSLIEEKELLLASIDAMKVQIKSFEETIDVKRLQENIEFLEAQLINKETFAISDKNMLEKYDQMLKASEERLTHMENLKDEIEAMKDQVVKVDPQYELYSDLKGEINRLKDSVNTYEAKEALMKDKQERFKILNGQMDQSLSQVNLKREHLNGLKALDILTLRALIHQRDMAESESGTGHRYKHLWIVAVIGLLVGSYGIFTTETLFMNVGVFLFGVGLAGVFLKGEPTVVNGKEKILLIDEIEAKLQPLNLDPAVAKGCTTQWVESISRLQELIFNYLKLHGEIKSLKEELNLSMESLKRLSRCPEHQRALTWIRVLDEILIEGEKDRLGSYHLSKRLDHLNAELEKAQVDHDLMVAEVTSIESSLELFGDSVASGRVNFLENLNLYEKIRVYKDELNNTENIAQLVEKAKSVGINRDEYMALKARVNEKEETLKGIDLSLAEIDVEKKHYLEKETLRDVRGKLEHLESEKSKVIDERNRLIIIREMIRLADQKFQENNKPQVIEKASVYLDKLTGGRYHSLFLGEEREIFVKSQDGIRSLKDAFSKGTKNQIYLAMRLSLMDLLDPGKAVPLILDDPLVNFDNERAEYALNALNELANERQTLFFTCHDFYRNFIYDKIGINVVEI